MWVLAQWLLPEPGRPTINNTCQKKIIILELLASQYFGWTSREGLLPHTVCVMEEQTWRTPAVQKQETPVVQSL